MTRAPAEELRGFIAKFSPEDQRLIRAVRTAMRRRLPTCNELVWDDYNFFVIGYSPTERPSDAIFSIAARAGSVSICFIYGARLKDPYGLLTGEGNRTRFLRLESAKTLSGTPVESLLAAAIADARTPPPSTGKGRLIIRGVSEKQKPRRKAATKK